MHKSLTFALFSRSLTLDFLCSSSSAFFSLGLSLPRLCSARRPLAVPPPLSLSPAFLPLGLPEKEGSPAQEREEMGGRARRWERMFSALSLPLNACPLYAADPVRPSPPQSPLSPKHTHARAGRGGEEGALRPRIPFAVLLRFVRAPQICRDGRKEGRRV
eukprot:6199959-Pleurochrysis_carterae.AAC.2